MIQSGFFYTSWNDTNKLTFDSHISPVSGRCRVFVFSSKCDIFDVVVPDNKIHENNMGPPGSCRPQMGPMLVPWTLLSGVTLLYWIKSYITPCYKENLWFTSSTTLVTFVECIQDTYVFQFLGKGVLITLSFEMCLPVSFIDEAWRVYAFPDSRDPC